ncbi:MAG: histidine utilization repressor [Alphaproteobacteria bacterium]|nr:histidine utilization repressor [Alphaproteobacteria bacterium]MBU0799241.1 histidine utilization repressor [Alphaproteobacteria bacterium]MBU0887621.1 histidine utilization repressor [Alphaproteobacteria bacterium]MBU1812952.1 histidine utilization repressor [Alphaproteobacteria bacterium]
MAAAPNLHQRIREEIEARILSGEWPPGTRIPVEHELMARYGCARMTVSKALSALATSGLIQRRRRTGSVVAAPTQPRAILQIPDFAQDAATAGVSYRFDILHRKVERLGPAAAQRIGLPADQEMLSIETVHIYDGEPVADERRLINLAAVPAARDEAFERIPPGSWLLERVPWSDAEHAIRAINANAEQARRLAMAAGAACLLVERRTWQAGSFITEARTLYPGDRHSLIGRFSPR